MLVGLHALDGAEVEHLAGVHHGHREIQRLLVVHAAQKDGHTHCGHLVVWYLALGVALHHEVDLLGAELAAVALGGDEVCH